MEELGLVLRQMWLLLLQTGSLKNTNCVKTLELDLRIALTLLLLDFSTNTNYFEGRAVRAPERILVSVCVRFSACPIAHVYTNL